MRSGQGTRGCIAGGATIWCTHFVAMIGYRIDLPIALAPLLTAASLLIAIVALHFIGMTAFRVMPLAVDTAAENAQPLLTLALAVAAVTLVIVLADELRDAIAHDRLEVHYQTSGNTSGPASRSTTRPKISTATRSFQKSRSADPLRIFRDRWLALTRCRAVVRWFRMRIQAFAAP